MPSKDRPCDDRFLDDMKRILGDRNGVLRSPPSRAELEEYGQLCGLLWGYEGDAAPPELDSVRAGYLRTQRGERIEIRYADWGGQVLEFLPFLKRVPECRIWLLKLGRTEYLIAMTDVTQVAGGHFPDLNGVVGPRTKDLFPDSYIEQRN
jgi:hypothetical protein